MGHGDSDGNSGVFVSLVVFWFKAAILTPFLNEVPAAGKGLNPLLQDFYGDASASSLYVGSATSRRGVPLRFGMALITRQSRRHLASVGVALDAHLLVLSVAGASSSSSLWPPCPLAGAVTGADKSKMPAFCPGLQRRRFCTR